jgi:hypothetical protein
VALALVAAAMTFAAAPQAARAQERLVTDVIAFGPELLGDWYARDGIEDADQRIRFEPGGVFRHGTGTEFGRYATRWKAERIALIQRQALIVEWAGRGTCAYYVRRVFRDGMVQMYWQPDRDERDLGPYDSILTRVLLPRDRCFARIWARTPPPPRPAHVGVPPPVAATTGTTAGTTDDPPIGDRNDP